MEDRPTLDNWKIIKTLGEGAFGKVKLAENPETKDLVALKILKQKTKEHYYTFMQELEALQQLDHINILKLIDYKEDGVLRKKDKADKNGIIYVALEYAVNLEIGDYLLEDEPLSEPIARFYFKQIIDALDYMHKKKIAHRDIKTQNLLLDKNYNLKFADLGFAKSMIGSEKSAKSLCKTFLGTEPYMAPEIHNNDGYDGKEVDIFAVGVVLFLLCVGKHPFGIAKMRDKIWKKYFAVPNKTGDFFNFIASKTGLDLSTSFMELVAKMLNSESSKRPTIEDIRNDTWYNLKTPILEDVNKEFETRRPIVEEQRKSKAEKDLEKQQEKKKKSQKQAKKTSIQSETLGNISEKTESPEDSMTTKK